MSSTKVAIYLGLWFLFSILWGAKAIVIRWNRRYVRDRRPVATNKRFESMSYFAFVVQIGLIPFALASDDPLLFKVFQIESAVVLGLFLAYSGFAPYVYALVHLGRNYSPCFDSHEPYELVATGPYRFIRHPGWLAKLFVGIAGLLVSGSALVIPVLIWLVFEMHETIQSEERDLIRVLPEYGAYRRRTKMLVPFLY